MQKYNPTKIEKKWQDYWKSHNIYKTKETADKKFYVLDMFPYPSGSGLHVGHPKGYIATDVYARYMMLNGANILHPMGFDSFGLPAENYAIKHKVHPQKAVNENIKTFKNQLKSFGFTYDWDREIITSDPTYYKWTQWIFIQLFKAGLAYESYEPINWCPSCKTGLANEDLEDGKCERCGSKVEKKPLRQWVLKITDYAERLLNDLKLVDWEKSIIDQQINWIGRSEGALIKFPISNFQFSIEVFTTRPDTLFGASYVVLAPEHALIKKLEAKIKNWNQIDQYIKEAKNKSDLERTELQKIKTGVEIKGVKAINPANNEELPVFIADYVLANYATGAVMAVPAHDERDFDFAKKYHLPIKTVISKEKSGKSIVTDLAYTGNGYLINSQKFDGVDSVKAKNLITKFVNGKKTVKYKMRDWVFSRQRYWGEPIPVVHCKKCGVVAVPEKDLPVRLPDISHYEPTGTGESPLANIKEWVKTKCPKCGGVAERETNTMPQWAGSSWYYLRYIDSKNNKNLVDRKKEKYWMSPNGVDLYIGGAEHATRHLLYARFWHKFLFDIKVVSTKEPFHRLQHVGLVLGEDNRKMSKRWGNVINPDEVISQFGADAFRVYEMFMGPFADSIAWSTAGVKGARRFLENVYKFSQLPKNNNSDGSLLQKTINKVDDDIKNLRFNTAISAMMIYINAAIMNKVSINKEEKEKFVAVLSPFAPHVAEEIWSNLGHKLSIFESTWPSIKTVVDKNVKIAVQINGKVRSILETNSKVTEKEIFKLAVKDGAVKKWLQDKKIKKTIYIPGKILSIVL